MNIQKTLDLAHKLILGLNETEDPNEGCQFISGVLANFVGQIPDDVWNLIMKESKLPCNEIGCNCEVIKGQTMKALNALRDDWLIYFGKKGGLN